MASTALATVPYADDQEVLDVQSEARTVADQARALVIDDEATNTQAIEMLSHVRKTGKRIDALKKRWLDPLNEQIKLIRSDFDVMAAPAKEADQILSRKTSDYRMQVQEAARKEQQRLRLLAEKRQAAAAAKAEIRGVEPPPVMPIVPTVAPPAKTVATESGSVTYRKQTHMEVTDPDLVPRIWCCPDEKKLGAAARAGIIGPDNCPAGVRVWITEEATVR